MLELGLRRKPSGCGSEGRRRLPERPRRDEFYLGLIADLTLAVPGSRRSNNLASTGSSPTVGSLNTRTVPLGLSIAKILRVSEGSKPNACPSTATLIVATWINSAPDFGLAKTYISGIVWPNR